MNSFLSKINLDMIMSDPMLLVGSVFVILGPLVFLVALWKFVTFKKQHHDDFKMHLDEEETPASPAAVESKPPAPEKVTLTVLKETSKPPVTEKPEPAPEIERPAPAPVARRASAMDQTIVMPPGMAEVQAQMEIAFTQIKTLNKQVHSLEAALESVARQQTARLEPHELTASAGSPPEMNEKLVKLAEHVVALEKEVMRLKTVSSTEKGSIPVSGSKPPIMPL